MLSGVSLPSSFYYIIIFIKNNFVSLLPRLHLFREGGGGLKVIVHRSCGQLEPILHAHPHRCTYILLCPFEQFFFFARICVVVKFVPYVSPLRFRTIHSKPHSCVHAQHALSIYISLPVVLYVENTRGQKKNRSGLLVQGKGEKRAR